MDHASFAADPKGYLQAHTVEVGHRTASPAWITIGAVQAGNNGGRPSCMFTHLRTLKCDFSHMGPGVFHEFRRGVVHGATVDINVGHDVGLNVGVELARRSFNAADKRILRAVDEGPLTQPDNGFRFLPFDVNQVNYMELDQNASFALTGPLTGCTIAVGRGTGGRLWFFHANENNAQDGYLARQSQSRSIYAVLGSLGMPQNRVQMCRYGNALFGYNGMGFVWGRRRGGGGWKFYSHYEAQGGGRFNVKWADC